MRAAITPVARLLLFVALLLLCGCCITHSAEPISLGTSPCQTAIPGDCNPYSCSGTCEGKYVRFWDSRLKLDRTSKSCQCVQEPICSLVGMHAYSGCRSYSFLSPTAQKLVRLWTMSERDRSTRRSIRFADRYSDRVRHRQLLNSYSRFCCRTMRTSAASATATHPFTVVPVVVFTLLLR